MLYYNLLGVLRGAWKKAHSKAMLFFLFRIYVVHRRDHSAQGMEVFKQIKLAQFVFHIIL